MSITILVIGDLGTGKTTIMNFIKAALMNQEFYYSRSQELSEIEMLKVESVQEHQARVKSQNITPVGSGE